jgi:putative transposase
VKTSAPASLPAKQKARRRPRARRIPSTGGCFGLTDELWALLEPLLPVHQNTHPLGGGRPRVPERVCAEAIFFVLRTGCQWNALAATGLCASSTAHDRCFQQWVEEGFFLRFWQAGLAAYDAFAGIDWAWMSMDGAMTKAPLAGEKNRSQSYGSRQTGRQTLVARGGWRRACRLVGGRSQPQRLQAARKNAPKHSHRQAKAYRSPHPQHVCLDKGYDYEEVRAILQAYGFVAHIRSRGEEAAAKKKKSGQKARRWVVERTHSWFNRFRSLLTRWSKKAENYLGMLYFVCGLTAYRAALFFG